MINDEITKNLFDNLEIDKELSETFKELKSGTNEKEVILKQFKQQAEHDKKEWFNSIENDFVEIPQFKSIQHFIKVLNKGLANGLILYGRGGIGKSRLVLSYLKAEKLNFVYNNSYTTPLSFAKFLYDNREDKIIVLDDIEGILKNKIIMSMLKSALDTKDKRLVYYNSTSNTAKELIPSPFLFNSRIIILINSIPDNTEIESLFSRLIVKEVELSYSQIINMAKKIITCNHTELNEKDINEIVEFLKDNTTQATQEFNFRTIDKVVGFYKYNKDKWKLLAYEILENDEELEIIRRLMTEYSDNVMKQFINYQKLTGKSRATFFRKKKCLKVS